LAKFYVTGGKQRPGALGKTDWKNFDRASVYAFDSETRKVTECVGYTTPSGFGPPHPEASVVFKAGSRQGDRLIVPTQTEILVYALPEFRQVAHISHPLFNDVHHAVASASGNILVANTGLDLVMEVTTEGELVQDWQTLPDEDVWGRFDRATDYRKIMTTKPHHSHPNFVFEYKGEVWVTRFVQRDIHCLTADRPQVKIPGVGIHDGNLHNGVLFVTSVDGKVIKGDLTTGERITVHDLNNLTDTDKDLGWCRGLHILDPDRVLVGFSRLRPTKIKENLTWVKYKMGLVDASGRAPTRVACYNLAQEKLEWEINLEDHGLNVIFSIIPADD